MSGADFVSAVFFYCAFKARIKFIFSKEKKMEWLTAMKKSIDFMEAHLLDDISADDVAAEIFMSPFYFQRGFKILTEMTPSEYIRNRRLYLAALDVLGGKEKVIDIALKYRYETPESFTRAFTRFHGVSPVQLKNSPEQLHVFLPLKITISITGGNKMEKLDFTVSPMFGFKVIGFEKIISAENAYKEIPEFWNELCEKYFSNVYSGKKDLNPQEQVIKDNCIGEYGVCIDDIGGGKFRYMVAGKYCGGKVPDGLKLFDFPDLEWAKFKCVGPMPKALQSVNTKIFKEWLPGNPDYEMAGGFNIEWYDCERGSMTDEDYRSAIWIPVKQK